MNNIVIILLLLVISTVSSKMFSVSTIHTRSNAMNSYKDMSKGTSTSSSSRRAPYYFFVRTLALRRPNYESTLTSNLELIETSTKEDNARSIEHHVHTKDTFMISVAVWCEEIGYM